MEQALVKTKKIGGSIMVRIPKEVIETESIHENELIKITVEKVRKSGFGMAKGLGPFKHEKASDFD
ncbi:MAG: AbrB/MazE/SpoVT family DNA-binding domain-containing protein [Candidatus Aenigmarchaeota archaeon]|nr:AbrB/MazE/SpoVT family DNA-binding domain-containing protein [Candidatus Aenigmarchaeota archaeon]